MSQKTNRTLLSLSFSDPGDSPGNQGSINKKAV